MRPCVGRAARVAAPMNSSGARSRKHPPHDRFGDGVLPAARGASAPGCDDLGLPLRASTRVQVAITPHLSTMQILESNTLGAQNTQTLPHSPGVAST